MFYRAAVVEFAVQAALSRLTGRAITLCRKLGFSIRLLIMKLDSHTFENMYGLCLSSCQVIAVFDSKLMLLLNLQIHAPFCVTSNKHNLVIRALIRENFISILIY
jgi:hypothetical protein